MGLIQREIEKIGIPTISVSIVRRFTEEAGAPRAVFLKWPMGHPLGEPGRKDVQTTVLKSAFNALETIKEPGTIIDLPYRWKRYEDLKR
ncbi:MAG: hypothetical protein HZB84_04675 [Deltaproteobacteria bacterium]|nr:hypothetical protein [Deltaproteobacteria bacterium]MBI5902764.1 hypothetical protein [Deltaproteobacteria bacterium]